MGKAKDGTSRGRPPLFGEAGQYRREYAQVPPEIARRIGADALGRHVSMARVVRDFVERYDREPFPLEPVLGGVRIYVQIRTSTCRKLEAKSREMKRPLSSLLGAIVCYCDRESPRVDPEEKRIAE